MTCAVAMNESMMCEMYERQSINLKVIDKNKGNHYNDDSLERIRNHEVLTWKFVQFNNSTIQRKDGNGKPKQQQSHQNQRSTSQRSWNIEHCKSINCLIST